MSHPNEGTHLRLVETAVTDAGLKTLAALPQLRFLVIGSHSDAHVVLSTLDPVAQRSDLATSVSTLSTLIGAPVEAYCHPFGGFHTFDHHTESTLTDLGIRYAFNVEPRTVSDDDLRDRPMALPRFDCNQFPHGRAHIGARRPEGAT